jgi:CRP-like cAMP-binding protein
MENLIQSNETDLELHRIFQRARTIQFPKRSILFSQGQDIDQLFYLEKGRIKLYVISPDGKERILQFINSGETFGEPSVFAGIPNGCMAMAIMPSVVKMISKQKLFELIRNDPDFAQIVIQNLTYKLLQLGKMLANNSLDMSESVAKTLLELLDQKDFNNQSNTINLTHHQLADYIGVSRATISNVLQNLKDEGLIQTHRGSIEVLDKVKIKKWIGKRYKI